MLGLFVFLYFVMTNRTRDNLVFDSVQVALSQLFNLLGALCSYSFFCSAIVAYVLDHISFLSLYIHYKSYSCVFKFLNLLHHLTLTAIFSIFRYSSDKKVSFL